MRPWWVAWLLGARIFLWSPGYELDDVEYGAIYRRGVHLSLCGGDE